jgi:sugar/nucleoside kinase (ribokinase family)
VVDSSIGSASGPTLLVVGAAARDLDSTDPRGWRLGGTVAYASLAAARLGVRVRALVGVDEVAASAGELETLRSESVDVRLVPLERGPVFDNRQSAAGRVQVVHQASDRLQAAALTEDFVEADAVLLGPVADELSDDWAAALPRSIFVALTWQGLLRRLVSRKPVELLPARRAPLVERANALLLSAEDVRAGAPPIRELLSDGQHLLLTHGEHGAAHIRLDARRLLGRTVPSMPPRAPRDTTGAGDVFFAAWLSARLLAPEAGVAAHLDIASVASSLKVANHGLDGVPSRADICRELLRLRD